MPSCSQGSGWCWPACSSPDFFSLKRGVAFAYFQPFLGSLIPLPSNFQAKRAWLLLFSQVSYLQFLPCDPYSCLSSLNIVKIDQIFMLLQGDTRQERHKRVELLAFFCTFLLFLLRKGVRILLVLPVCSSPGAGQVEKTSEQNLGWSFIGGWGFSSP